LERFAREHPTVQVQAVLVDAWYGTQAFLEQASALFGGVQVISQRRHNQKVRFRNRSLTLETFSSAIPASPSAIHGVVMNPSTSSSAVRVCG